LLTFIEVTLVTFTSQYLVPKAYKDKLLKQLLRGYFTLVDVYPLTFKINSIEGFLMRFRGISKGEISTEEYKTLQI